jgi:hypothetical protein
MSPSELEQRFHKHYTDATGPVARRNAIAIAMMELEDPALSRIAKRFSAADEPIFLTAYQAFILWLLVYSLHSHLPASELQEVTIGVKSKFATFAYHKPSIFERIWEHIQDLMPIALRGGSQTGVVYPLPHIIQAAIFAGYQLPMLVDHEFGMHVLSVMHRVAYTLGSDANPKT